MCAHSSAWTTYKASFSPRVRIVDAFLAYCVLSGVAVFAYCVLFGTFPFNAFLAAWLATIAAFCLGVGLRMSLVADSTIKSTPARAVADFCFAFIVLLFFAANFVG